MIDHVGNGLKPYDFLYEFERMKIQVTAILLSSRLRGFCPCLCVHGYFIWARVNHICEAPWVLVVWMEQASKTHKRGYQSNILAKKCDFAPA